MSSIGPVPPGAANLAASVAGSVRSGAETDEAKFASAVGKAAADRAAQSNRALGDVDDPNLNADRDADGREFAGDDAQPADAEATRGDGDSSTSHPVRATDVTGERGTRLDLEA